MGAHDPELATAFQVLAPEQLGFGATGKVFDFVDLLRARIRHIARVLDLFGVEPAHFVGASTAGTMMLSVAASSQPAWPIDRIIGVSAAGGRSGGPEVRAALQAFDGSFETTGAVIGTMYPERWWDDAYVERGVAPSTDPERGNASPRAPRSSLAHGRTVSLAYDDYVAYERIERPVFSLPGGPTTPKAGRCQNGPNGSRTAPRRCSRAAAMPAHSSPKSSTSLRSGSCGAPDMGALKWAYQDHWRTMSARGPVNQWPSVATMDRFVRQIAALGFTGIQTFDWNLYVLRDMFGPSRASRTSSGSAASRRSSICSTAGITTSPARRTSGKRTTRCWRSAG